MKVSAPTAAAAAAMSASVAPGRPKPMLSRIVPENRKLSWGTIPSWERSDCSVTSAEVVAVHQHAAVVRVVEAGH